MNPTKTDEPIETSFARRLAWVRKHLLETGPNLGKGIFEDAEKPLHIRRYGVVRRGIRTRVCPIAEVCAAAAMRRVATNTVATCQRTNFRHMT